MRRVMLVLAAAAIVSAGCGSKEEPSAAPPPAPPTSTSGSTARGTTPGTGLTTDTAPTELTLPVVPAAEVTEPAESSESPAAELPQQPNVPVAPDVTYDPALAPWCDALGGPIDAAVSGTSEDDVRPLVNAIEPLKASLGSAPPEMVDPVGRLVQVLELLKAAVDSGEVTNKDSMIRWGLVNLQPDQITVLQDDLMRIVTFMGANCPPA